MKRNHSAFWYFSALAAIYLILIFVLPVNSVTRNNYSMSAAQYHILLLLVEIPLIAVWFIAFYGYARLCDYAKLLTKAKAPEGQDFSAIARGAKWIAWGFPVPAIISLSLNTIANDHPSFHSVSLIISNYLTMAILLVAFSFVSNGSRALARRAKLYVATDNAKALILFFVVVGVAFCYFAFRHLNLHHLGDANNPYFLPTWLAIVTLVIPYLYTWFIGLLAAYQILTLARRQSGVLYRQALQLLVFGLVVIIANSTALQYFRSIVPRTGHLSLGSALLVVYIFEIGAGAGFGLLAYGAKRLKKIEEV